MPEIIQCPSCNRETYAGLRKCAHCGTAFKSEADSAGDNEIEKVFMANGWAVLPPALAVKHDYYAFDVWTVLLVLALFLAPIRDFYVQFEYIRYLGYAGISPIEFATSSAILAWAWICGLRLISRSKTFFPSIYWLCGFTIAVGIFDLMGTYELRNMAIIFLNTIVDGGAFHNRYFDILIGGSLKNMVTAAIVALYVHYSKRINFIVLRRVRPTDPFFIALDIDSAHKRSGHSGHPAQQ